MAHDQTGQDGPLNSPFEPQFSTYPDTLTSDSNSVAEHSNSKIRPSRSSSVRFASGTSKQRQSNSMGRRRGSHDSDEIRPIRTANQQSSRTYNTTEPSSEEHSPPQTNSTTRPQTPKAGEDSSKPSWWKSKVEKYGSITLDNKGSVARDHLALERTFLAWLRTSLAFASIGIAITQLFRLNTTIQNRQNHSVEVQSSQLPLSPLVGHGLPAEMVPLLQQLANSAMTAVQPMQMASTLLDQLLLQTQPNTLDFGVQAFDSHSAAKLRRVGKPLGATFIGISIVVLLVGFHRYFEAQHWIIRGKFPASRGSIAFVGFVAGALIVTSMVVVLVVAPVSYEKR